MMCEYQRIAAAVPRVTPGDVSANLAEIDRLLAAPEMADAAAVVFPELCLTGYTCADLFYRPSLLAAAETALACLVRRTLSRGLLIVVGLPVRHDGRIFNCAAVLHKGLKGLVPKSYLPGTREFYESRWFATAQERTASTLDFAGEKGVPFGNDLLFAAGDAVYGVEICEDMWTANPPSTRLALQGANILLNPSASNEVVGKTEYRRALVTGQSARCLAAYVYAGAGPGESTTDLVFGGHALIAENGNLLAEGARFRRASHLTVADVDVDFLNYERSANFAFRQGSQTTDPVRRIELGETPRTVEGSLLRPHDPHPFVP
ncbi:MAG TPA: NAD(+) synthase, partial [Verrucomicrobia bacterium]|nr:NAD(+) synthase [Verrucomicrobiota bacterium]